MKILKKLQNKWWDLILHPLDVKDVSFTPEHTEEEQKRVDIIKTLIEENLRNTSHKCLTIKDFPY